MKTKKSIFVIAVMVLAVAFIIPASISASRNPKNIHFDNYDFEPGKAMDNALKVEAKLNDAWSDIKSTFSINDSEYTLLCTADEMNAFTNLQLPGLTDKKTVNEIDYQIMLIFRELPIGSTEPVILIKNDLSSFDVCYKLADGTNVRNHGTLNAKVTLNLNDTNSWSVQQETKQGKPQMEIKN